MEPVTIGLRRFRHKGVVYMLDNTTQYVYCYNPTDPIQIGVWDRDHHTVRFLKGALDALRSGDLDALRSLHLSKKSSCSG